MNLTLITAIWSALTGELGEIVEHENNVNAALLSQDRAWAEFCNTCGYIVSTI